MSKLFEEVKIYIASGYSLLKKFNLSEEKNFNILKCRALKDVEELSVQEEIEVTRSKKTDKLNKNQTTPSYLIDNRDQSTMEALEQDVRRMEDTREEKTLRDVKDGADLRDTIIIKYENVRGEKNIMDENEDTKLMNEREENNVSDEEDVGEEKKVVWGEKKEEEEKEENSERDEKDEKKEKDLEKGIKDVSKDKDLREKGVRPEKSMGENEDVKEERETKEIERGGDIGNGSEVGDPIWRRISETESTRKAWKVPVTSTTRTGDATKNMEGNNALLICGEKVVNRSRNATNESRTMLTRNPKETRKEKKTEAKQTITQRIKIKSIKD